MDDDEVFGDVPNTAPADFPSPQSFDASLDGEETVDWEALAELIEDFLVYAVVGPLGNCNCEVGRSEISHGTKFFK